MKRIYLLLFIISFFIAAVSTNHLIGRVRQQKENNLLDFVTLISAAINPDRIKSLTASTADYSNPDYLRLSRQLTNLSNSDSQIRYLYLMAANQNDIYFLVDSQPEFFNGQKTDDNDLSPPGEIYQESSQQLKQIFASASTQIIGPETDRWGTFISALTPVIDPESNRMIAMLGADVEIDTWNRLLWQSCLPSCLVVLLILLIEIIIFYFLSKSSETRQRLLFLASVLESSDDAIYSTDLHHRITSWNRGAEKTYGYKSSQAIGSNVKDLIIPQSRLAEVDKNLKSVLAGESQSRIETIRKNKSGDEFYVWLTVSPVYTGNGIVSGVSIIARDISPQKKFEEELRQRNQQLEKINRLMVNRELRIKELKKIIAAND